LLLWTQVITYNSTNGPIRVIAYISGIVKWDAGRALAGVAVTANKKYIMKMMKQQ